MKTNVDRPTFDPQKDMEGFRDNVKQKKSLSIQTSHREILSTYSDLTSHNPRKLPHPMHRKGEGGLWGQNGILTEKKREKRTKEA